MARQRDYKAEYARLKAQKQAQGFATPYQQRIRGGASATPDSPVVEDLRRARGHAGAAALIREFVPESSIAVATNLRNVLADDQGRFDIPVIVTTPDGDEIEYFLHDIDEDYLDYLIDWLDDMDADYESGGYDIRALAGR